MVVSACKQVAERSRRGKESSQAGITEDRPKRGLGSLPVRARYRPNQPDRENPHTQGCQKIGGRPEALTVCAVEAQEAKEKKLELKKLRSLQSSPGPSEPKKDDDTLLRQALQESDLKKRLEAMEDAKLKMVEAQELFAKAETVAKKEERAVQELEMLRKEQQAGARQQQEEKDKLKLEAQILAKELEEKQQRLEALSRGR